MAKRVYSDEFKQAAVEQVIVNGHNTSTSKLQRKIMYLSSTGGA